MTLATPRYLLMELNVSRPLFADLLSGNQRVSLKLVSIRALTNETTPLLGSIGMKTKELILQEMEAVPEPILAEVLDFLQFLKAKRTPPEKQVTVVSATGEVSIPLATLAMQEPEIANQLMVEPMPVRQMCDELKQALTQSGYTSREKIVELVQDVKREILTEKKSQTTATHV